MVKVVKKLKKLKIKGLKMNYGDILECLKTIQNCLNNNDDSCNKVKEKCFKKLLLELVNLVRNEKCKAIKDQYKKYYKSKEKNNIINNITNILIELQKLYIEELYKVNKLLNIFHIFEEIELNKKENNKKQLEQIKEKIKKENFNDNIEQYLIKQIDNYIKQIDKDLGPKL